MVKKISIIKVLLSEENFNQIIKGENVVFIFFCDRVEIVHSTFQVIEPHIAEPNVIMQLVELVYFISF